MLYKNLDNELAIITAFACCFASFLHVAYFVAAPFIWSCNLNYDEVNILPWILDVRQQDGLELFVLYSVTLLDIFIPVIMLHFIKLFELKKRYSVIILLISIAVLYSLAHFKMPYSTFGKSSLLERLATGFPIACFALIASFLMSLLLKKSVLAGFIVVAIILLPICLIATDGFEWLDCGYIFDPALRILQGFKIKDTYFQYDLLFSLIAAAWIKMGFGYNSFQSIGQLSYYLAILMLFHLALQLFRKKTLVAFFVASLVLVRIYASPWGITSCPQTTPIRLDLWIFLVMAIFYCGPFHWLIGFICGALIMTSTNFGIIYTVGYLQLLVVLCIVDCASKTPAITLPQVFKRFAVKSASSIFIICLFSLVTVLFFKSQKIWDYGSYYQKIGIGFQQISRHSFYWYVFPVFSLVAIIIYKLRKKLTNQCYTVGLSLACAVGNSLYFFGRSEENNILNISLSLIFVFFILLDLFDRWTCDKMCSGNKSISVICATIFVGILSFSYAINIHNRISLQMTSVINGDCLLYKDVPMPNNGKTIFLLKKYTSYSKKVFFATKFDLNYYALNGYVPISSYSPFFTWIFQDQVILFLQSLLDSGYYVVFDNSTKCLIPKLARHGCVMTVNNEILLLLPS